MADHYLLTARSITHAQQMSRILEHSGIHVNIHRAGPGLARNGCGYTVEVSEGNYARASALLLEGGYPPVRVFFRSGSRTREVRP